MEILFTGEEKLVATLRARTNLASRCGDLASASDDTAAAVYCVSGETAVMTDYATLRAAFENLKSRRITVAVCFADFPRQAENWLMYWAMVLPFVDWLIIPYAAALAMFEGDQFAETNGAPDAEYAAAVSLSVINLGAAAALFTFSPVGVYLRSSSIADRLAHAGKLAATTDEDWRAREIFTTREADAPTATAGLLNAATQKPAALLAELGKPADYALASHIIDAGEFSRYRASGKVFLGKFDKVEA
ncbi:MAG: hypothetical protein LBP75_07330 [Planctomycetota bacterium]|jgi:hypothetical protein|nr:hypothetical protein [Planctomycetota bacterium]